MKELPLAIKYILNLVFFVIYCVILQFLSGYLLGLSYKVFWKAVPYAWDPMFVKIGLSITFFTLLITLVFRKYFYMSIEINDIKNKEYKEKDLTKQNKKKVKNKKKEDIKIFIEKELNK